MKREISAGGVVFNRELGKVLLIKDSYGRWALPKGHIEKGESSEQAALREISEETGLKQLTAVAKLGQVKYFYNLKGENIFKMVVFFLVEAKDTELKHEWEIKDAKWFKPDDALETIEYANSKALMKKAVAKVRAILAD
jgi:8-oxo-dGTP pyrophosphatase MutT (NUDIX family)